MSRTAASARKVVVIAGTELRRFMRDRTNLFFVLVFPLLLILIIGMTFGGGFRPGLGVAGPVDDPLAREVITTFEEEDEIVVVRYGSESAVRRAVERGSVQAGVVIPDDYSRRLDAGHTVDVGFVVQPTGMGAQLRPIVEAAVSPQSMRLQAARFADEHTALGFDAALERARELETTLPPQPAVRTTTVGDDPFPAGLGEFDVGAPSMLVLFVFINGLASSLLLVQNRQIGVSRRVLSTPTASRVLLAGELLGRLLITLVQGAYIVAGTWLLFRVGWGDPAAVGALLLAFALVATGAAMLAGAVLSNEQQVTSIGVFLGLGMAALGGSMVPLDVYSATMREVARVTPHAWANEGFAEVVRHGAGVGDILPQLGVLAAMAAVLMGVATWRLRHAITTA